MTTQPREGGRRAIDRVLAPGFADDLPDLPMRELRARRQEAEQEEVDLSYARRLLQGRLDLLLSEQAHQAGDSSAPHIGGGGHDDAEIAASLSAVMADGPRADHGLGRHLSVDPSRVGEHRRAAEQAVADVGASDPSALDPDALTTAIEHLRAVERDVSDVRHRVQAVMDLMTAEVARRYKEGEASVDEVLAAE